MADKAGVGNLFDLASDVDFGIEKPQNVSRQPGRVVELRAVSGFRQDEQRVRLEGQ
jgi:hypothetical protein